MKQFFYTILFVALSFAASAQKENNTIASNLTIKKAGGNIELSWTENNAAEGSWEVQASADGNEFTTIGLVWGADPKATGNSFAFKQDLTKIQPEYAYFRVLFTEGSTTVKASKTVEFSK